MRSPRAMKNSRSSLVMLMAVVDEICNRGNRGQTTFCIYGVFVTIVQSFKKRVLRGVVCRPKAVFS